MESPHRTRWADQLRQIPVPPMTSTNTGPTPPCDSYIIIGYTIDCGAEGDSAGQDTKGDYVLRISVQWPASLYDDSQADDFYVGSTLRGYRRHTAPLKPEYIDTFFEGGGGKHKDWRADDTQDIADKQAAVIEEMEQSGTIPEGLVEVETDGGERGDCHARVKIWCPEHVDLGGHVWGKFTIGVAAFNMPSGFVVKPADDPKPEDAPDAKHKGKAGQGGWGGSTIPADPVAPEVPNEGQSIDDFLDPPERHLEHKRKGKPFKPAEAEKGRKLLRDRVRRRGGLPIIPPGRPKLSSNQLYGFGLGEFTVCAIVGSRDAIDDRSQIGLDLSRCRLAAVRGYGGDYWGISALCDAFVSLGVHAAQKGVSIDVRPSVGTVVGFVIDFHDDQWRHIEILPNSVSVSPSAISQVGSMQQLSAWPALGDCCGSCNVLPSPDAPGLRFPERPARSRPRSQARPDRLW